MPVFDPEDPTPLSDPDNVEFQAVGICHTCTHRRSLRTCSAFPDGIPLVIITGEFMHTRPYPGDHGITFTRAVV